MSDLVIDARAHTVGGVGKGVGAGRPGDGSGREAENGHGQADIKAIIDGFEWVSGADRQAMLESHTCGIFPRVGV